MPNANALVLAIALCWKIFRNGNDLNPAACVVAQFQLVDRCIKTIIVRPKRVQDLPYYPVTLIVVQRFFWCFVCWNNYRKNDVAKLLACCPSHHTTNALHHVNL
ncbi:hypothetical protein EBBID32_6000 [Sphingobium indicum BiD32]|uniref:Uncharacterized protein n=1 Tax=Sphingobium indicum BiD32 TaxID=1301087 RepID=N1MKZ3_9SPHN|nr:hypothetical protein EBBID32_6000 [Sphingobium indicum BiD32]